MKNFCVLAFPTTIFFFLCKVSGTVLFEELILETFHKDESHGKFIVIRKKTGGLGGEIKKESYEFSSKPFSRFIFLLQFSWEYPSVWLYIYFSVFTCQYFVFVAALNLLT